MKIHLTLPRTVLLAATALAFAAAGVPAAGASSSPSTTAADALVVPAGAIKHVIVIDLENESYATTFGPTSPATYLNHTLLAKGELIPHYYATGHVSLDNYLAQVSGQAPNQTTNSDCNGAYLDMLNGGATPTLDPNQTLYPGQVDGQGCVQPASAATIGDQLDALHTHAKSPTWREYAQDMGSNPVRDGGTADTSPGAAGGTTCAHPALGASDPTNGATASDQYANRHNPFVYFHSVVDNTTRCNSHVVPLGTVAVGTPSHIGTTALADTFSGHLVSDLANRAPTPAFMFITPNLCNDGHDGTCAGPNTEGTTTGGLVGADLWLKHWMPLILGSHAYKDGSTLVVVTFDEGNPFTDQTACCNEQPGPNYAYPGASPLLLGIYSAFGVTPPTKPGDMPGGGQIGAVVFNSRYIKAGSTDTIGAYNHYSALRSYEDLLGITTGGADGQGHLGFAAADGLAPFGADVFNSRNLAN
jgi:phosphatidylinositol-3-phosphatase